VCAIQMDKKVKTDEKKKPSMDRIVASAGLVSLIYSFGTGKDCFVWRRLNKTFLARFEALPLAFWNGLLKIQRDQHYVFKHANFHVKTKEERDFFTCAEEQARTVGLDTWFAACSHICPHCKMHYGWHFEVLTRGSIPIDLVCQPCSGRIKHEQYDALLALDAPSACSLFKLRATK
jgi:hypothetical protein